MTALRTFLCASVAILVGGIATFAQSNLTPAPKHVDAGDLDWEPANAPGFPEGRTRKLLHINDLTGAGAALIRHPAGYVEPMHYHTTAGHSLYVLEGRMRFEGVEAAAGDFFYTPPNHAHGPLEMLEETVFLIWTDGQLDTHLGAPGEAGESDAP